MPQSPGTHKKLLFLTSDNPFTTHGGGKIRDAHLLNILLDSLDVELLHFDSIAAEKITTDRSAPSALKVSSVTRVKAPLWVRAVYPLRPYIVNGYSEDMAQALRDRAEPGKLLWISRLAMAQYLPLARELGYRVILDEHNVEVSIMKLNAGLSIGKIPGYFLAAQCGYYESRFCALADVVTATSDIDASRLAKMAPEASVRVIPNCIDCSTFESLRSEEGDALFFSGSLNYAPNVEGLEWFMDEIIPRLRAHYGNKMPRILVVGSNPSPEFQATLRAEGIEVHANPPSILPFLKQAAAVFVPIRSGGGTRLKILEAMAAGRAVVSTGKGAEGLVLSPSYDVLISDGADSFTSDLLRVLENPDYRRQLAQRGMAAVKTRYDWLAIKGLVSDLLKWLDNSAPKQKVDFSPLAIAQRLLRTRR